MYRPTPRRVTYVLNLTCDTHRDFSWLQQHSKALIFPSQYSLNLESSHTMTSWLQVRGTTQDAPAMNPKKTLIGTRKTIPFSGEVRRQTGFPGMVDGDFMFGNDL